MLFEQESSRAYDMVTGERLERGEMVLDTRILTSTFRPVRNMRTMLIKESTIVWLAEEAGFTLTRSDAGNPSDTEDVGGEDASVGGGETPTGPAPAGGSKSPKRSTAGPTKG
jgi:hypothetical protein